MSAKRVIIGAIKHVQTLLVPTYVFVLMAMNSTVMASHAQVYTSMVLLIHKGRCDCCLPQISTSAQLVLIFVLKTVPTLMGHIPVIAKLAMSSMKMG